MNLSPPPWSSAAPAPKEPAEMVEPTDEERRNGWDADTLTAYVAEARGRQEAVIATPRRQVRPSRRSGPPMRWSVAPVWNR